MHHTLNECTNGFSFWHRNTENNTFLEKKVQWLSDNCVQYVIDMNVAAVALS